MAPQLADLWQAGQPIIVLNPTTNDYILFSVQEEANGVNKVQ